LQKVFLGPDGVSRFFPVPSPVHRLAIRALGKECTEKESVTASFKML
jgi:hypothetical protein